MSETGYLPVEELKNSRETLRDLKSYVENPENYNDVFNTTIAKVFNHMSKTDSDVRNSSTNHLLGFLTLEQKWDQINRQNNCIVNKLELALKNVRRFRDKNSVTVTEHENKQQKDVNNSLPYEINSPPNSKYQTLLNVNTSPHENVTMIFPSTPPSHRPHEFASHSSESDDSTPFRIERGNLNDLENDTDSKGPDDDNDYDETKPLYYNDFFENKIIPQNSQLSSEQPLKSALKKNGIINDIYSSEKKKVYFCLNKNTYRENSDVNGDFNPELEDYTTNSYDEYDGDDIDGDSDDIDGDNDDIGGDSDDSDISAGSDDVDDEIVNDDTNDLSENDDKHDPNSNINSNSRSSLTDYTQHVAVPNLSAFELKRRSISQRISELEMNAVADKPWMLKGEVKASERDVNSLLEHYIDVEYVARNSTVITDEITRSLDDKIKDRIKNKQYDDPDRKAPPVFTKYDPNKAKDIETKFNKSLMQIYEEEYLKNQLTTSSKIDYTTPEEKKLEEKHKELSELFNSIIKDLESLSNLHFVPSPPNEIQCLELKPSTDKPIPSLMAEENLPTSVSEENKVSHKEKFKPVRKIQSDTDLTSKQKKRIRSRVKKNSAKKRSEKLKLYASIKASQPMRKQTQKEVEMDKRLAAKSLVNESNVKIIGKYNVVKKKKITIK